MATIGHWAEILKREPRQRQKIWAESLSPDDVIGACQGENHQWRERFWTPLQTIQTFLLQVLHVGSSCRESVAMALSQWEQLPLELSIRLIRTHICIPGFRCRRLVLATTLLDPIRHPSDKIIALYRDRWIVELRLRDIKTTLGIVLIGTVTYFLIMRIISSQK